jgi:bifunctional DNA-binding transcriptional regulator/antitoxin component of YhaV-PrlF toxin-antitoxin module
MASKVGRKGQVVIDHKIRAALGVRPGAIAVQRLVGDHVEIRFLPAPHACSLKGALAPFIRRRPQGDPDDTEAAWAAAVHHHRPETPSA